MKKAFKNVLLVVFGDADPTIADGDNDLIVQLSGMQNDPATVGSVFNGVFQQPLTYCGLFSTCMVPMHFF